MPDYKTFSWDRCLIHRDAPDIGSWPVTSTPERVQANDGTVVFEHTMAGEWPLVNYGDIYVEGCIWTIAPTKDGWRAATWDRLRPGQTKKDMDAEDYQEPYALAFPWVPRVGDVVGYLVSTPARMDERGPYDQRSPIAWVTFGGEMIATEPVTPTTPPTGPPDGEETDVNARLEALENRVDDLVAWAESLAYQED